MRYTVYCGKEKIAEFRYGFDATEFAQKSASESNHPTDYKVEDEHGRVRWVGSN